MEYYLEIREKRTPENDHKPQEIFRKYVADVAEAEEEYKRAILAFADAESEFVEMKHDPNPKKNRSCVSKKIVGGKVQ